MFEFSKLQFRKDIKMLGAMLAVFYAFLLFFGWIEHRGQHLVANAIAQHRRDHARRDQLSYGVGAHGAHGVNLFRDQHRSQFRRHP